ncbi:FAD-dependent oxidoreductase [Nocardia sp. NPDC127606]|uniref:FAD-dependent oxidoreductase n=1 Tax=Nocardia sp. NPDC127606 TaxID=3345406 RepID=UPI00362D1ADF
MPSSMPCVRPKFDRKWAEMPQNRTAIVAGAGVAGLTTAIALRRSGFDVTVYERAEGMRSGGFGLSVMSNAVAALDSLGIDLDLEQRGRALERYYVKDSRGKLIREFPFPEIIARLGVPSVCIGRGDLLATLRDQEPDLPVVFGAAAERFEVSGDRVRLYLAEGREVEADVLIGADGFHSAIRRQLNGPEEGWRESGYIVWLGITDYAHPRFEPGSVVHFWGDGKRFGLVDIGHGRLYWWATENMPLARAQEWSGGRADLLDRYRGWAEEVVEAIRITPEDSLTSVITRDRPFIDRWGSGPVTLVGDAAHPMLTSLGQGAAMAIEDAAILAEQIGGADDISSALRAYEDGRRDRTRAVVEATRAISDFEQSQGPVRRRFRDAYFRLMPHRALVARLEPALTFPGHMTPGRTVRGGTSDTPSAIVEG